MTSIDAPTRRRRRLPALLALGLALTLIAGVAQAGHWVHREYWSWSGSRFYQVWIPDGYTPGQPMPMVVALHGCLENPDQFAELTRLNQKADSEGFIVLYPNQASYANASQCWNWMLTQNQRRDSGEPGMIKGMMDWVRANYSVDARRMYVGGISAGGGMTAVMLACYPELFAAGAVHAGVMYKAATTLSGGVYAMQNGSIYSPDSRGYDAWSCGGKRRLTTPLIVFHGTSDGTVDPNNGSQVVQQFLQTSDYGDDGSNNNSVGPWATSSWGGQVPGGRSYTVRDYHYDGQLLVRKYEIHGMDHAWSGGNPAQLFADAAGPDSTSLMWNFFRSKTR